MALLNETGGVLEQYQWEPYGLLAAKDTDTGGTIPHSHIGHQGLFFYRFNPQAGDTAALSTTAVGLYHNRNRWYSPSLGRFTSRDPNEAGILVLRAYAMNGQVALSFAGVFDPRSHYRYGENLYLYLLSNPFRCGDPLGLMPEWLANTILWATGGEDSWLDDPETVQTVSDCLAWGGTAILMFTPANVVSGAVAQVSGLLRISRIPGGAALGRAAWGLSTRFVASHKVTGTIARVGFGIGLGLGIVDAATGQRAAFVPTGTAAGGTGAASILTNLLIRNSSATTTMALPFAGAGGVFVGHNAGTLVGEAAMAFVDAIYYDY